MNIQNYSKAKTSRHRKLQRKITGIIIAALIILIGAFVIGKLTENSAEYQLRASLVEENRVLREENEQLKEQVSDLQNQVSERDEYIDSIPTAEPSEEPSAGPSEGPSEGAQTEQPSERPIPTGTTPRTQ